MFACKEQGEKTKISFYHWKSYWNITLSEIKTLDSLNVNTLYVRYFDVGWRSGTAQPLGKIVNQYDKKISQKIIPTIFITNATFLNSQAEDIEKLSDNILQLIESLHQKISTQPIEMIQFDCDWTQKTKGIYFDFLRKIQQKTNYDISVTIRLHQVKYKEKTGIPPAQHFVLMCYNTGRVSEIQERNSILDNKVVQQYINKNTSYPHRLEIALPLFQWGVLFRDGKMIKLLRNVGTHTFSNSEKFEINDKKIHVLKGTYLNGYYLYKNDEIRLESVTPKTLLETRKILQSKIRPKEIIFYHLDSSIIKTYPYEILENLSSRF